MSSEQLVRTAIGLLVLLGFTALVLRSAGVRLGWAPFAAVARGAVQLAVVGLALRGVLAVPAAAAAVLVVMLTTATWTSSGRVRALEPSGRRPWRQVLLACACGAAATLSLVFAVGMLPFQSRYVIALGGSVLGGTMTGATLAGRHLLAGLRARRDEVEAWLSLGASPREATADVARAAAGEALVPALDQTRTTGLVTLPGAFIGALLGGASPTEAARFQLIVLVALITAETVVAVLVTRLFGAPEVLPAAAG